METSTENQMEHDMEAVFMRWSTGMKGFNKLGSCLGGRYKRDHRIWPSI